MKHLLRPLSGLCLAVLLIVTAQSVAVARGMPGPAGHMVLCTGSGPVMIFVDANGTPTDPPQYCPEGALALLGAVALTAMADARPQGMSRARGLPVAPAEHIRHTHVATARGPPLTV